MGNPSSGFRHSPNSWYKLFLVPAARSVPDARLAEADRVKGRITIIYQLSPCVQL